jgi:hypothetical protein
VAGLATAHWVATAIALCHGALAAYIAGDLKIMCATRRLVSASIVRALSPGRRQPTLPRHALRLRRYRLRPSRRLRTEAVCLQITPVTSATLPVRLPFPPPWSAAHWSLTNPAFPAGNGVARASSLANFLAGVQQVFDDIAGWGTWILRPARRNGLKSLIRLAVWAPTVVNTVVKVAPWKPLYRRHRKRTRGQCAGVCRGATGCHIALPSGAGRDRHTAAPVKIGPHRCMAHDAVAHRAKLPAAPDGPHQSVSQTLRDEGRSLYSRRRRPELVSRYDGITKRGRNPNHRRDGSLM